MEPITPLTPALFEALSKAQAQFKSAIKDSTNPHFRSNYADLASIWDACKEGLAANDLFVSQYPSKEESGWVLYTRVYAKSGEFIECCMPILTVGNTPQAFGSAMTYARRYSLAGILGIVTDDDDAEGAMSRDTESAAKQPAKAAKKETPKVEPPQPIGPTNEDEPRPISVNQKTQILLKLNNSLITKEEKDKVVKELNTFSFDHAERALRRLDKVIQERQFALNNPTQVTEPAAN